MSEFVRLRSRKIYEKRKKISDDKSKQLLRFEPVERLATYFLNDNRETRGGALNNIKKMEIFLRFLSDPGFQSRVGQVFGVHRSTVTKTISYVCDKVVEKAHEWIKFPTTLD